MPTTFSATEIVSLVIGMGGILSAFWTYRSSARTSDVDLVKSTMTQQANLIKDLQSELQQERTKNNELEAEVQDLRKQVQQLQGQRRGGVR